MSAVDKNTPLQTEDELEKVLKANDKVCVLFYASWCPYSQRFLPVFEKRTENKDCYARVEINDDESLAEKYSVEVYPTLIFFEKGKVTRRLNGTSGVGVRENQFFEFINKCGLP